MTQDDKDALIGSTIRKLRDVREKLAALRASGRPMGDAFDTAATHLRTTLEYFILDAEGTDGRFVREQQRGQYGYGQEQHIPRLADLDIKRVLSLRDEIRACLLEEQQLEKTLTDMGFSGKLGV